MHKADLVMDFQYGSTGKGLIAGYLAREGNYDSVVCSFATNAGHTYINKKDGIHLMTQQLPTGIVSPTVRNVFIGPGALIHIGTLRDEMYRYNNHMQGKRLLIHPHAAIVLDEHAMIEMDSGQTKMGSTGKGVGASAIQRIERGATRGLNIACNYRDLDSWVVTAEEYREEMDRADAILIEGAQGFSLSMYHGFYPYTTSRDVTVWQIAADCGIPTKWMNYLHVIGTLRTYPIRVNNRDGSSGPGYPDQKEISWGQIGVEPELTTVTKLPRRLFTFSQQQLTEAMWHNGGYWRTSLFLNFCNYLGDWEKAYRMITEIEKPRPLMLNAPKVVWTGWGPDHADISCFTKQI